MTNCRRANIAGATYFFTVSVADRHVAAGLGRERRRGDRLRRASELV